MYYYGRTFGVLYRDVLLWNMSLLEDPICQEGGRLFSKECRAGM